jgi:hypothetical protein
METPQYLFQLLEAELFEVQSKLLQRVASKYDLSHAALVEEFLGGNLQLIPNSSEKITVKKQKNPPPPAPDEARCWARIWNRGKGGQCTKRRVDGSDFCKAHVSKRKHGDFREEVPREMFPHRSAVYYK